MVQRRLLNPSNLFPAWHERSFYLFIFFSYNQTPLALNAVCYGQIYFFIAERVKQEPVRRPHNDIQAGKRAVDFCLTIHIYVG